MDGRVMENNSDMPRASRNDFARQIKEALAERLKTDAVHLVRFAESYDIDTDKTTLKVEITIEL